MSEGSGTGLFGKVNNNLIWLVMCRRRTLAALAPSAKREAKCAVQRNCLWRDAQSFCEIHQAVIGLVQISLALVVFYPVTELDATETERI